MIRTPAVGKISLLVHFLVLKVSQYTIDRRDLNYMLINSKLGEIISYRGDILGITDVVLDQSVPDFPRKYGRTLPLYVRVNHFSIPIFNHIK